MLKTIILFIIVLFMFNSCNKNKVEDYIREDEYHVYDTVIDSILSRPLDYMHPITDAIVIIDSTKSWQPWTGNYITSDLYYYLTSKNRDSLTVNSSQVINYLNQFIKDSSISFLKADYDSVNTIRFSINKNKLKTRMKLYFAKSRYYNDSLYATTNGYAYLSRVGLSKNRNYALVTCTHSGGEEGIAYIIVLEKKGNKWEIIKLLVDV